MTRTARMPKKKHLEATSWEEMRLGVQDAQDDDQRSSKDAENSGKVLQAQNHMKKSLKHEREHDFNLNNSEGIQNIKKMKRKNSYSENTDVEINGETNQAKKKRKKKSKDDISLESESAVRTSSTYRKENTKDEEIKTNGKQLELKTKGTFKSRREQKLEKQREARRKRRAKRNSFLQGITCFHCREVGHTTATCPQTTKQGSDGCVVCYKCGGNSHTTKNCKADISQAGNPYPFAKCFICGETGHISRSCPDNPRGLYPKGGGCNICGSVEHLKRDCPEAVKTNRPDKGANGEPIYAKTSKFSSADAEVHSDDETRPQKKTKRKKEKVVKF